MKKYKAFSFLIVSAFLFAFFSIPVFANSSWVWISEKRPFDILPWVAIATLIIESFSIIFFAKPSNKFKVFSLVTIANAVSFVAPYLVNFLIYQSDGFEFEHYLDGWPSYTVGILFCAVTVLIELPIVYCGLKTKASSNRKLLYTVVASNIFTTVLVAIAERLFCTGSW